jgi:hypothetical protein
MKVEQRLWRAACGWSVIECDGPIAPSLVLFFASPRTLDDGQRFAARKSSCPSAALPGCVTGGEIAAMENLPFSDLHNRTMTITTFADM